MAEHMITDAIKVLRLFALRTMINESLGEDGAYFIYLRTFVKNGFSRDIARAICRDLRDEGMAVYGRGLMDEDGDVRGAGYAITDKGRSYYANAGMDIEALSASSADQIGGE